MPARYLRAQIHGSAIIFPSARCVVQPPGTPDTGSQIPDSLGACSVGMQSPWHSLSSEHALPASRVLMAQKKNCPMGYQSHFPPFAMQSCLVKDCFGLSSLIGSAAKILNRAEHTRKHANRLIIFHRLGKGAATAESFRCRFHFWPNSAVRASIAGYHAENPATAAKGRTRPIAGIPIKR
jgi:hypothetical protein